MKKIISLTKIFIKEYYQNLPIFDNSKKRLNKKSVFFWLVAFVFFGGAFVSYEAIKFFVDIGHKEIFLNFYFLILMIFLAFQTILMCANVFFFSKDVENVLHMPIKSIELLIAKFNTLLFILYCTEGIIGVTPLFIYGLMNPLNIMYFIWAIIILIIYPIFVVTIISILIFLIMRISKFVRNKEVFQVGLIIFLMCIIFIFEHIIINNFFGIQTENQVQQNILGFNEKANNINNYLIIVNPSINMLLKPISFDAIISFVKIIFYNFIVLAIFIAIGSATYLKDILQNLVSTGKKQKKNKEIKINKKSKSKEISIAYVKKEIKLLFRNSTFFMQCIFPVIILLVSGVIFIVGVYPVFLKALQDEQLNNAINNLKINTEVICDILVILQVLFSISNISLTAISRDGKNAVIVKYLPIELYKQFIYKSIPQFVLNLLITVIVLWLVMNVLPSLEIMHIIMCFAISIFINLINCYLMLIVDLLRPNINWTVEEAVVKKSDNKMFQYAFMIFNVLLLLYIANVCKEINIYTALIIELVTYGIIFIIIDRCIKKWQVKLFDKIS